MEEKLDYEKFRAESAANFVSIMCNHRYDTKEERYPIICQQAIKLADELTKQLKQKNGTFEIVTNITRGDLEALGYDTSKVSDETMEYIASNLKEEYNEIMMDCLEKILINFNL